MKNEKIKGQGKVREFELSQGNLKFWKMTGNYRCVGIHSTNYTEHNNSCSDLNIIWKNGSKFGEIPQSVLGDIV